MSERKAASNGQIRSAFTLIELLVGMAVLSMIVVLVALLTSNISATVSANNKRLDADSQARMVFGQMAEDFENMIDRKDVDCFFVKNTGALNNDAMYFYAEVPGYFSNANNSLVQSPLSIVGYRIANHGFTSPADMALYPDNILERISVGLHYEAVGGVPSRSTITFLSYATGTSIPNQATTLASTHGAFFGSAPTWDGGGMTPSSSNLVNYSTGIGPSIFRMEFCFQVKNPTKYSGNLFSVPIAPGASPWSNFNFEGPGVTSNVVNTTMRQVCTDVSAIIVTIAILDPKSQIVLTPSQIAAARQALPDGDTPAVLQTWTQKINDGSLTTSANLPQSAAGQVRVYQRCFPISKK